MNKFHVFFFIKLPQSWAGSAGLLSFERHWFLSSVGQHTWMPLKRFGLRPPLPHMHALFGPDLQSLALRMGWVSSRMQDSCLSHTGPPTSFMPAAQDQFEIRFWKLRQAEYGSYTLQCSPIKVCLRRCGARTEIVSSCSTLPRFISASWLSQVS